MRHLGNLLRRCHAKSLVKHKKNIFLIAKIPCVFARLCYSLSMTENEKEIAKLYAQLEQVAEDLLNPCLDDQTTVLIRHMG
jgi:hypothetical protein